MSVADEVRAEEREAREQQAHMERMRREAQRARVRAAAEERRELRRTIRGQLRLAEAEERKAHREYEKWTERYNDAPDDRSEALGRLADRAFVLALAATEKARRLREELRA